MGKQAAPKQRYTIPVKRLRAIIDAVESILKSNFRTNEGSIIKNAPNKVSSTEVNLSSFFNLIWVYLKFSYCALSDMQFTSIVKSIKDKFYRY